LTISPITKKRINKFKKKKRAITSLYILISLFILSLFSNIIANDKPLLVKYKGKIYFPVFKYYPESTFADTENKTRPDYKAINQLSTFTDNKSNYMIFPPVPFSPYETLSPSDLDIPKQVEVKVGKILNIASININQDGAITRSRNSDFFFGVDDKNLKDKNLKDFWNFDSEFWIGVSNRFKNLDSPMIKTIARNKDNENAEFTLSTFAKRSNPIKYSKITIREKDEDSNNFTMLFNTNGVCIGNWNNIPKDEQAAISSRVKKLQGDIPEKHSFNMKQDRYNVILQSKSVNWPYAPCKGHIMGIDAAGRDVFARILYALRTSLMFGLTLVSISMILGILAGSIQGYYGGVVDISFQRFTEVWSALPFLYIMILLGSVLGRGFGLFLLCYGLFNWIGISYYMRAEYLRSTIKNYNLQTYFTQCINPYYYIFPFFTSWSYKFTCGTGLSWIWVATSNTKLGRTTSAGSTISLGVVVDFISVTGSIHSYIIKRIYWRRTKGCF